MMKARLGGGKVGQGAQRLEAEVDRMRSNTAVAARRLGLLGGTP